MVDCRPNGAATRAPAGLMFGCFVLVHLTTRPFCPYGYVTLVVKLRGVCMCGSGRHVVPRGMFVMFTAVMTAMSEHLEC